MIQECQIYECEGSLDYLILNLPGRGNDGGYLADIYAHCSGLERAVFAGLTPAGYAWYPMPRNPDDQAEAVAGLARARAAIEEAVDVLGQQYGIPKERTVLAGYSAGGVMAIETAVRSVEPFAAVLCHCGAILEPDKLPPARHPTPFVLFHNRDDNCFFWDERFEPMKAALVRQGYDTHTHERPSGGHVMTDHDIRQAGLFLSRLFGVSEPDVGELQILPCRG